MKNRIMMILLASALLTGGKLSQAIAGSLYAVTALAGENMVTVRSGDLGSLLRAAVLAQGRFNVFSGDNTY